MNLNKRYINYFIVFFTSAFALISYFNLQFITTIQWYVIILLLILLGIPHGATDHLLYYHLTRGKNFKRKNFIFLSGYLTLVTLYAFIWYLSAYVALALFLCLAAYHFGQSNLEGIRFPKQTLFHGVAYLLSGMYVIFLPIILRYHEAQPIVMSILGESPVNPNNLAAIRYPVVSVIIILNVLMMTVFVYKKYIRFASYLRELVNLGVLLCLFAVAPMLLSFIIYFSLWHALGSTLMQIEKMKQIKGHFSLSDFYKNALPFTMLAFAGIFTVFFLSQQFDMRISYIGLFFIIISTVTLPHMVLIDRFYQVT
jgi:Brp/Blh family beta-carotene 15,15'-monooxygenase